MKRFHVHAHVDDLQASVAFYSKLFAAEPARLEADYAKWMLEDPRINFAISTRGLPPGVNHLGIQVESDTELKDMRVQLIAAQAPVLEQKEATCCYAKSDKYWVTDPAGVAWESFRSLGTVPFHGDAEAKVGEAACCAPVEGAQAKNACCA